MTSVGSRLLIIIGGALLLPAGLQAQEDFEAFQRREAEQLRRFMSREDSAFASFLKREWKSFELSLADRPYVRPKPRTIPVAPPRGAADPSGGPAPTPAPVAPPVSTPATPPATPPTSAAPVDAPAAEAPAAPLPGGAIPSASALPSGRPRPRPIVPARDLDRGSANVLNAAFYGALVTVPRVELKLKPLPDDLTSQAVAAFWEQISAAPLKDVLASLRRHREQMALGDWAYAQLVYRTALTLANDDTTTARLVAWHLLVKSGYVARVGFKGRTVHVLLKSNELLYGTSFFTIDNARYYVIDLAGGLAPEVGSIRTYDRDHPEAKKPLGFQMASLPWFAEELRTRQLQFKYDGKTYQLAVGVNQNLIDFLTHYPQTELGGYLNAEIESTAMDNLVEALRPHVAGRTERDAVNFLLRMVQTSFDYKTDAEQFRREKWFFPEETLFYPFSDCEDRSILFSYLVRKLVPSVKVVGLLYADHVATAVKFSGAVSGDTRAHRGETYVVSDPTYIGADVGMEMPQYKSATPRVIEARAFQR